MKTLVIEKDSYHLHRDRNSVLNRNGDSGKDLIIWILVMIILSSKEKDDLHPIFMGRITNI